jgi:fluoride exporter
VNWFLIVLGGMVGAPCRYFLDRAISPHTKPSVVPWGTIVINVLGSALLGFLAGTVVHHRSPGLIYAVAGTGFCGAFTTFSTFTWETLALAEDGRSPAAVANVAFSLVLGLGAAALGYLVL